MSSREEENKKKATIYPPHYFFFCSCPHLSHQHRHIQQWLLRGLIHYVVNWLLSITLVASSSQYQGSLIPKLQLPPTLHLRIPKTTRQHKVKGTMRKRRFRAGTSDVRLVNVLRAGNPRIMWKRSQFSWHTPSCRDTICRNQSVILWTFNSHDSMQHYKHT